jgi:hypothetical protein
MLCLSYYAHVFCSTKPVIRAEQNLPETEGGKGGRGGEGVRVDKWPKQQMHMWIKEQQQKRDKLKKIKIKIKKESPKKKKRKEKKKKATQGFFLVALPWRYIYI